MEVDLAELERHMDEVIEGMGEIPIENRRLRAIATIGESSGITIRVGPSERGLKLDDAVRARIEAVSSGASTPR
ncbi:MAG: hypothetical protein V2J02_08785 [Pseudomonadales bacterium]|nr:hypothetical protein [Pseudomonadales bacterium]